MNKRVSVSPQSVRKAVDGENGLDGVAALTIKLFAFLFVGGMTIWFLSLGRCPFKGRHFINAQRHAISF